MEAQTVLLVVVLIFVPLIVTVDAEDIVTLHVKMAVVMDAITVAKVTAIIHVGHVVIGVIQHVVHNQLR